MKSRVGYLCNYRANNPLPRPAEKEPPAKADMCGVAGFKGGVTFLAFSAGTRGERYSPALHAKRLRAGRPSAHEDELP
jgi:hypothetical protein